MEYPDHKSKIKNSLPWLMRYPFWRAGELLGRTTLHGKTTHVIVVVANHFEPAWQESLEPLNWDQQIRRVDDWAKQARAIGNAVRDVDGKPFVHTMFYPAEQYNDRLVARMAEIEAEGLGEIEIHFHHGVEAPDTAKNTRQALTEFRDTLAGEHQCLSRMNGSGKPMYAFVHGNLALANSLGGQCCGVDNEMEILAETGCYADLSMPTYPFESQGPMVNLIYECGGPFDKAAPHHSGKNLQVGRRPKLPVMVSGPLLLGWRQRPNGLPLPAIDSAMLTAQSPLDLARFHAWRKARISVADRPEWIFVKLACHGFFDTDQPYVIGEPMKRFWLEVLEESARTGEFQVHFATAREAFNMVMAAVGGCSGTPGEYRDYLLHQIRREAAPAHISSPQKIHQHA